jgi:hypothetical protein
MASAVGNPHVPRRADRAPVTQDIHKVVNLTRSDCANSHDPGIYIPTIWPARLRRPPKDFEAAPYISTTSRPPRASRGHRTSCGMSLASISVAASRMLLPGRGLRGRQHSSLQTPCRPRSCLLVPGGGPARPRCLLLRSPPRPRSCESPSSFRHSPCHHPIHATDISPPSRIWSRPRSTELAPVFQLPMHRAVHR